LGLSKGKELPDQLNEYHLLEQEPGCGISSVYEFCRPLQTEELISKSQHGCYVEVRRSYFICFLTVQKRKDEWKNKWARSG